MLKRKPGLAARFLFALFAPNLSRLFRENVAELLEDPVIKLFGISRDNREGVLAAIGNAGIDDDARIARILMAITHRIKMGTPTTIKHFNAVLGIAARTH